MIPGLPPRATQKQVESALGEPIRFSRTPTGARYAVGAGIVAVRYSARNAADDERYLERVRLSAEDASTRWVPVHERCSTCSDLLVRSGAPGSGGVDLAATAAALVRGVEAGTLTPVRGWVQPADMHPLLASGLMPRLEVRARCAICGFVICFAVSPGVEPTFEYITGSLADKQERIPIPPVELWADSERIARDRQGLRVIDHGPSAWFLLRDGDELHLDARYSHSGLIDDSALIRLDADEQRSYRDGGHAYISALQQKIHESAPFQKSSPYYRRDLYRGPERKAWRTAVQDAIGIWQQDALWWDGAEGPRDR